MEIRYRCGCMKDQATVEVADRTEGQDYADWVHGEIGPKLDQDHAQRSPDCPARKSGFHLVIG